MPTSSHVARRGRSQGGATSLPACTYTRSPPVWREHHHRIRGFYHYIPGSRSTVGADQPCIGSRVCGTTSATHVSLWLWTQQSPCGSKLCNRSEWTRTQIHGTNPALLGTINMTFLYKRYKWYILGSFFNRAVLIRNWFVYKVKCLIWQLNVYISNVVNCRPISGQIGKLFLDAGFRICGVHTRWHNHPNLISFVRGVIFCEHVAGLRDSSGSVCCRSHSDSCSDPTETTAAAHGATIKIAIKHAVNDV